MSQPFILVDINRIADCAAYPASTAGPASAR